MQLEAAKVVSGCRVGRAFEERREPLAALDVAALCMTSELARDHIVDHAMTEGGACTICSHGEFLPEGGWSDLDPQGGALHPVIDDGRTG